MKRLLTICLVLLLCASAFGKKVKDTSEKLGSFTGPVSGAAQDDNVKASLDLLHALIGPDRIKGTGSIFYVDSGVASTAGTSWSTAVGTVDAGVNLCTDDRGDIILVAAGHAENLAGADAVDVDQGGITIIGLGVGENRPVLSFTASGSEFVIGNDDIAVYNIEFLAHTPDVAHAIEVLANMENLIVDGCRFSVHTAGTDEFTDAIETADGADNMKITNCVFEQAAGAADTAISLVGADYTLLSGNVCYGDYAVACLESLTTASVHITIKDNILFNGTVGGNTGLNAKPTITMKTDTTGVIINNQSFCNVVSPEDAIVAADMFCAGNTYSENEQAGGSEPIGRAHTTDILASLGVSMSDGTTRGRVVYVDSGETTGIEDGLTWATATDTLDEGVDLCTDADGSTIFIAPGHTETMGAAADEVDIDVSGLTVIGLGRGDLRPLFDFTGKATGAFAIGDDYVTVKNLRFHANITDVNEAIEVEAGSICVTIEDCVFDLEAPGTDDFLECIDSSGTASDELHVIGCEFYMGAGAANSAIYFKDSDHAIIKDCISYGDYAVANINQITTASNHITIENNRLFNGTIGGNTGLNAQPAIEMLATTTGTINLNYICCNHTTAAASIVADDCYLFENYYNEDESSAGTGGIIGAASGDD